jgi:hypothetical protein
VGNQVWGQEYLADGRDAAAVVGRLNLQCGKHRVCQNMGAPFEIMPVDLLRGIVELKRIKSGLEVEYSVTVDRKIKIVKKALRRRPYQTHLSWSRSNARRNAGISPLASGRISLRPMESAESHLPHRVSCSTDPVRRYLHFCELRSREETHKSGITKVIA